ncbi:hypothetical protein ACFDAU_15255 [Sulfuriferula sp. GW1]|uniref:hypothetical protein n=1 Tax=Sulfuriferula sp. GW1 TaxID=3345111 RepID=UPI0039B0761A
MFDTKQREQKMKMEDGMQIQTKNGLDYQIPVLLKTKLILSWKSGAYMFALMALVLVAAIAQADPVPVADQGSTTHGESAYSTPVVPLDQILNPSTPLSGNYPVHDSGVHAENWFWMDNHRIIFWTREKKIWDGDPLKTLAIILGPLSGEKRHAYAENIDVTKIWDVNSGAITRYRVGSVTCYQDGIINIAVPKNTESAGKPSDFEYLSGPMGLETAVDTTKKSRLYMYPGDCGNQPSAITRQYMEAHPDEYVKPLRKEDGFIVLGKHSYKNRGPVLPQDFVIFYPMNSPPLTLHMNNNLLRADYYNFANAYLFVDSRTVSGNSDRSSSIKVFIHILLAKGELREIKKPDAFSNASWVGGVRLTQRGIMWTNNVWSGESGIYLSHGEKVNQISHDSVTDGKVSPDGCRFAYMNVELNQPPLQGKLKVIDLCEEVQ